MELIILRHGKAEAHGHPLGDGARELIDRGRKQARHAGNLLKKAGMVPDLVLTSPLVRTRQTAEEFCKAAEIDEALVQPWLACGMQPERAMSELAGFSEFQRVAIVGHEPDLSELIRWLLGASGLIEFKTGTLACLEIHPPSRAGTLLYMVPPKLA
ncbi:phosphohistidine phosphatase SixA [Luteolibacter pohnpeiensis]|uniref:Phosphohistidine phosphatase SixA n=1 Tax=Luteolibacter pohnpeiensis TaxID=454153 RepID=A0A934VXZ1_9BACT|nr:phosphohistidine phosphatase SixA [Luteolibacter pohnpeiensis]MBK1883999.1 phosphohistidine phosphatase SixA [Luteolibacter pohnpeiensis]